MAALVWFCVGCGAAFVGIVNNSFVEIVDDGVCFKLTPKLVRQFYLAKRDRHSLSFSTVFLEELNDYMRNNGDILAFYTYYQEKILVKSVISISGSFNNYFHQDCLSNADLTQDLTVVHHWLITEVLGVLKPPVVKKIKYDWLSWVLSFVIVALIVGLNLKFLIPLNLVYVGLIVVAFVVLRWVIKGVISLISKR